MHFVHLSLQMHSEKCSDKYKSERLIQELLYCQKEKEGCETVAG